MGDKEEREMREKGFFREKMERFNEEDDGVEPSSICSLRHFLLRIRNRSGLGKKAEIRKSKKGASTSSEAKSRSSSSMYLPPVALKEEKSGWLKVDFGFSSYSGFSG
ncbi:hypothetical protein Dsin_009032 [Dipteronia sinensis]|uniref:Uncharacterized protein n=1 Tax=Dipteronia sinensis TaxID=43782 RepID=A0AAE0EBQ0_9ROSI|nr:hypothetical protein Dsin_009032 [Dipteronia sinensis]